MARGEYGPAFVGDGRLPAPTQTAFYRSYAVVFRERLDELNASIQQADRDYASTYKTNWGEGATPGEPGLDQSIFVFRYWLPFVKEWNATRERLLSQLLAGQIDRNDRGPALWLSYSAARFNDLKQSAGASWGLGTAAPNVVIHGTVGAEPASPPAPSHPSWKDWLGAGLGVALIGGFILGPVRWTIQEGRRYRAEERSWEKWLSSGLSKKEGERPWSEERTAWKAWERDQRSKGHVTR